jgi:hypothetical protein
MQITIACKYNIFQCVYMNTSIISILNNKNENEKSKREREKET